MVYHVCKSKRNMRLPKFVEAIIHLPMMWNYDGVGVSCNRCLHYHAFDFLQPKYILHYLS